MLEHFGVTEANWRDADRAHPALRASPRARASSAAPSPRWPPTPTWRRWNGQSLSSGQLAQVYGFTDLDGSRPDAGATCVEVQDAGPAGRHDRLPLSARGTMFLSTLRPTDR